MFFKSLNLILEKLGGGGIAAALFAALFLLLPATAFAEQTDVLFVANGYYQQETDIYNHLQDLGMVDVEIKKDYQIYGSTDLTAYELIIITGFAPNIGYSATNNIKNSNIPVMIIEYWDFWYSYKMGLLQWDSGDYYGTDTVELINDQHPITNGLDQEIEVYDESWAVLYGASLSSLSTDTEPLIYSWQSANEAAVIVDDDRKMVATGIYDTSHYTDDAWEIFDNIIYFLLPYEFPPPPPALATLFVVNGWDSDEDAIEEHLANDTRAFEIVRMTDSEIDGSTNLMNFDLVVISPNAPGISSAGLANITDSGVPTLIIEDDDFGYAHDLGLTTTASGVYATTDTMKANEDYSGALLRRLGSTVTVQQPAGDVAGISASEMSQGVTPLYYSNFDYDHVGIFIDHSRKMAVTGLSDTSRYTSDAWVMLDALIREIADMDVRRTSLQETAQTYINSGIPNFLELAKIERIRDPETWTFEAVRDKAWLMTVEWRLYDLWDLTYVGVAAIFDIQPLTWDDGLYDHATRPHVMKDPFTCYSCKSSQCGGLPPDWSSEKEYWFLGETPSSFLGRCLDVSDGDTDGNSEKIDELTPPPAWGVFHDGVDLGISVNARLNGITYYYMGDTWNADFRTIDGKTSWSKLDCTTGAVCNDMVVISGDPNADNGIDVEPLDEWDGENTGFSGLRIEQVHYKNDQGRLAPALEADNNGNPFYPSIGKVAAAFNVPTGAITVDWNLTVPIINPGSAMISYTINMPVVMIWYGTAIAPDLLDSDDSWKRPTSWAGCSLDGEKFFSCYTNSAGEAVPFSMDISPGKDSTPDGQPARFIQISPVKLTAEDFEWICMQAPESAMCEFPEDERGGLLLYGSGRPYRKSGLFLGYIPNKHLWMVVGDRPIVRYWAGPAGWSDKEADAVSLSHAHGVMPPCDICTEPGEKSCCNPLDAEKDRLFGELSTHLVRGDDDRKVFLFSNPGGAQLGANAWRFSIKYPWQPDSSEPHNLHTIGYGPYIIPEYSDDTWSPGSQDGPRLYHLISTWGQGPYGVYSGEEVVPWSP